MKTALRAAQPHSELYDKLTSIGWALKKIDMKNGLYVATGVGPSEQEAQRVGQTPEMALAALLNYATRSNAVRRFAALQKFAAWSTNWLDQKGEIAQAYSKMPTFDEKAVPAWRALAAESKIQADAIRQQIRVDVTDEPEPYVNAEEMCRDIHQNKHFLVSRANTEHPLWSVEDNINFRIVHDVLGHCQSGGDFSWQGENLACGVHFPLVSPLAREALFTECIGQTAYRSHYRGFGPQKIGLLSEYLHPAQEREGEHVFVPHAGIPALQEAPNQNAKGTNDLGNPDANTQGEGQWVPGQAFTPVMQGIHGDGSSPVTKPWFQSSTHEAKLVSDNLEADPNHGWQPSERAEPVAAGDPNDYIDQIATIDNAAKIDTEWWNRDEGTQRRAIMNAFRVAILSPRKHLKWNAAHYQALMHTDPATSAMDMWHILEGERERHNQGLGHPEGSHLRYRKNLEFLADQLAQQQGLTHADAMAEAKKIVFEKVKEFEAQLGRQPDLGETSELRRYNMARKMAEQWLMQNYSPGAGWMPGQMALAAEKTADYQGWSNWETWNARLMIDNEYETYTAARKLVEQNVTPEQFEQWAVKTVIGPYNNERIKDAQEWNDIPQHERLDYHYEDLKDRNPQAADFVNQLGFGPNVEDDEPEIIDPNLVNWTEVINSLREEVGLPPLDIGRPAWLGKVATDWASDPTLFDLPPQESVPDSTGFAATDSKYGAFMGAHLDALADVGQHIDAIHNAALEDLEKDGGKGFIFRNKVMNMNLAGVNPKVCSFAWLLLAPMHSELGIIDTHVVRGLRRSENDMNVRDYYKMERMQRALKDASGYSHLPLGLYHWGLWDHIRNPGFHSDHSPLRVLDPHPWDDPEHVWDAAASARDGLYTGHPALEAARPYAEEIGNAFADEFSGQPSHMVPFVRKVDDPHTKDRRRSPFVVPFPVGPVSP